MLTEDERGELDLLYERVYGARTAGDAAAQADLDRVRQLEDRARATQPEEPAIIDARPHQSPRERRRFGLRLIVGVAVASVMAGLVGGAFLGRAASTTQGEAIPEFNYIATREDTLPGDFDVPIDASTVRFIATIDDGTVFVGRNAGPDRELCIIVISGGSSDGFYGSSECGEGSVTSRVSADTWVVIGEPQTEKMDNRVLSRFRTEQLSESVTAYSLRN